MTENDLPQNIISVEWEKLFPEYGIHQLQHRDILFSSFTVRTENSFPTNNNQSGMQKA